MFLEPNLPIIQKCMAGISELSVGKILSVYHHGIEKKFHCDGFEINSERDIKSVLQIESVFPY